MKNSNQTPEELNPTNGNENNDNLQNNSEENTQNENVEKQKAKYDSSLPDLTPEEEERRTEDEDRELWERINESERDPNIRERRSEDEENKNEDNGNDADPKSNNEFRDYKGSNKKLASLRRVRDQKQKKYQRLVSEMNEYKAELKRGYRIVKNGHGQVRHVSLTRAEKDVISFKISDRDYKRFMIRIEIQGLDQKISQIATKKRTNRISKKKKVARSRKEDKLVQRVSKELSKAAKNGSGMIVRDIQSQIQSDKRNEAYNSIKFFLSKEVKPVAKTLDKDKELEIQVIERVLDKMVADQS